MSFKVNDKVKVIASKKRLKHICIPASSNLHGMEGVINLVTAPSSNGLRYRVNFDKSEWWFDNQDLELVENIKEPEPESTAPIRKFDTGATRDTVEGKLDYVRALSPIVLRRYVQYLNKHRLQPDGSMRDFDNWKKGIPQETYHSSKGRHFMDTWLLAEGYTTEDNHGPVNEEDALCGEIFNAMGKLHEILKKKLQTEKPKWYGYCPECEAKIAAAKDGELVPVCKKCAGRTSHVGKKSDRTKPVRGGY